MKTRQAKNTNGEKERTQHYYTQAIRLLFRKAASSSILKLHYQKSNSICALRYLVKENIENTFHQMGSKLYRTKIVTVGRVKKRLPHECRAHTSERHTWKQEKCHAEKMKNNIMRNENIEKRTCDIQPTPRRFEALEDSRSLRALGLESYAGS